MLRCIRQDDALKPHDREKRKEQAPTKASLCVWRKFDLRERNRLLMYYCNLSCSLNHLGSMSTIAEEVLGMQACGGCTCFIQNHPPARWTKRRIIYSMAASHGTQPTPGQQKYVTFRQMPIDGRIIPLQTSKAPKHRNQSSKIQAQQSLQTIAITYFGAR